MNKQRDEIEELRATPPILSLAREGIRRGFRIGSKKRIICNSMLSALCFLLLILACCDFSYAQTGIKGKVPDLCYDCHKPLKEKLSQSDVHFPFKQGKCEACHNLHASDLKNLIKEDMNSLCLGCHEGIKNLMNKGNVHGALKKGICTDCHQAHAGVNRDLLVKEGKRLCWDCHEPLKEQMNKSFVHSPFREGECASCHNAHASPEEDLLSALPNKTCTKCHQPRCSVGNVSISSITKELDCGTCHAGHSSNTKGLLGPYGHTVFLNKNCEQCHNPIVTGRKMTTKLSGNDLCFSCHEKGKTKFKEADVHAREKKGCTLCHDYHASKKKSLTVKESVLCFSCHKDTERRQDSMNKALKSIRCDPVKDRKCFACHIPPHSNNLLYLKEDGILTCAGCHKAQHRVAHPMGSNVLDPRNGKPVTCISCHSIHSAKADFMLLLDRKRALCIQCHKK